MVTAINKNHLLLSQFHIHLANWFSTLKKKTVSHSFIWSCVNSSLGVRTPGVGSWACPSSISGCGRGRGAWCRAAGMGRHPADSVRWTFHFRAAHEAPLAMWGIRPRRMVGGAENWVSVLFYFTDLNVTQPPWPVAPELGWAALMAVSCRKAGLLTMQMRNGKLRQGAGLQVLLFPPQPAFILQVPGNAADSELL